MLLLVEYVHIKFIPFCILTQYSFWDKVIVDSVRDKFLLFHRSEIDHLTELMRSRTVDSSIGEEGKRTEVVPQSNSIMPCDQKEEYLKTPALENGIENHLVVSTPYVTSSVWQFASYLSFIYMYDCIFWM